MTIAAEISPLDAAISSLMAEKSLALSGELLGFAGHGADDLPEPGAHVIERASQPGELIGHLAQLEGTEVAGTESIGRRDQPSQVTVEYPDEAQASADPGSESKQGTHDEQLLKRAGLSLKLAGPLHRVPGLLVMEMPYDTDQAVRGPSGLRGDQTGLVAAPDVGQRVGRSVRRLQLRLTAPPPG